MCAEVIMLVWLLFLGLLIWFLLLLQQVYFDICRHDIMNLLSFLAFQMYHKVVTRTCICSSDVC